jgi:ferric-chelate reductase (NADPH)
MAKMAERLADLASGVFLDSARVNDVHRLSHRFVKVELQAEAFHAATWTPGAKLQLRTKQGALGLRTYTPIAWYGARGVTQLIAFTHSEGPAAGWFRRVTVSDICEVLGPRRSIDLRDLSGRVVFIGDESSVGLACALRTVTSDVRHVFESTDPTELTAVLTELGFAEQLTVVSKSVDRAPLIQQARDAAQESVEPFDLVLSGDAATVHAVRRDARLWPRKAKGTKAKAYWAEGRTGLD